MIVDSHSHFGSIHDKEAIQYWNTHHRNPERVIEAFFRVREWVDRSIVVAFPGGPHISNNEPIAAFAREFPTKVVPFYLLEPDSPTCLTDLERGVVEWGGRGVKLAPIYQNFKPDDERYFPMYAKLEDLKQTIIWFQGSSAEAPQGPLEWSNPVLLDKVARTFPDLKMVIAHLGFPWYRETVALLKRHPNVFTDVSALGTRSWFLYNALLEAHQYGVEEKIFFGSEYPMFTPSAIRDALYQASAIPEGSHLPPLPEGFVDRLLSRDSLGMLGIQ